MYLFICDDIISKRFGFVFDFVSLGQLKVVPVVYLANGFIMGLLVPY
jgi:hypothetical protein